MNLVQNTQRQLIELYASGLWGIWMGVFISICTSLSIHIFWPFWAFFPPFESKFRIRTRNQLSMLKSFFVWRFAWHLFKIQWNIFVQNNKPTLTHFNGFAFCKSLLEKKKYSLLSFLVLSIQKNSQLLVLRFIKCHFETDIQRRVIFLS